MTIDTIDETGRLAAPLTVAAAQFRAGEDVDKNLVVLEDLTAQAVSRGAELVVFPEAAMHAWEAPAHRLRAVADQDAPRFVDGLREICDASGATVVAGIFAPGHEGRPVNRLVAMDRTGVLATYDKVHLYDAFHYRESETVTAGRPRADHTELGTFTMGPWTVGMLNCYDLRFPEMARLLTQQGVNVLAVSSAWVFGPQKEMHWEILLRARAIENTAYVVASSQPPPVSTGLSMVVDPLGLVASTCTLDEGLALHTLDEGHLREVRELIPSLTQRHYTVHPRSNAPADSPTAPPSTGQEMT